MIGVTNYILYISDSTAFVVDPTIENRSLQRRLTLNWRICSVANNAVADTWMQQPVQWKRLNAKFLKQVCEERHRHGFYNYKIDVPVENFGIELEHSRGFSSQAGTIRAYWKLTVRFGVWHAGVSSDMNLDTNLSPNADSLYRKPGYVRQQDLLAVLRGTAESIEIGGFSRLQSRVERKNVYRCTCFLYQGVLERWAVIQSTSFLEIISPEWLRLYWHSHGSPSSGSFLMLMAKNWGVDKDEKTWRLNRPGNVGRAVGKLCQVNQVMKEQHIGKWSLRGRSATKPLNLLLQQTLLENLHCCNNLNQGD